MDSQQLLDYLYRSKASLRRCLQGLADGTADRAALEQWISDAIALNKSAINELAEFEEPVTLDEIDTIFTGGTATAPEDSAAAALNTHEGRLQYSRACEITLRKGGISPAMLENRMEISPELAQLIVQELIDEEIIAGEPDAEGIHRVC